MPQKIVTILIVGMLLWVAYAFGHFKATWLPSVPCDSVQEEIDVYRMCMQSAGKTGCRMQIDDFRKYQQLKEEQLKRCQLTLKPVGALGTGLITIPTDAVRSASATVLFARLL